jgi:nucleoside phosphorylase
MRVLLADDGGKKAAVLDTFLTDKGVLEAGELAIAESGASAREKLRTEKFDLLIVDILLPWRDEEPTAEGSRRLLDSILFDDDINRPRQIVGLTADDAAVQAAGPVFAAHTWTVLRFDETSTNWMEAIASSIRYMALKEAAPRYETDLLVVTALRDPEMTAVHRLPWNWQAEEPLDDATFVRRGSFQSGDVTYSVVTAVADRMGMVSAAVLTTKSIALLRPRFCVIVGICAGIESETRFGDVILGDPVWDYQSGKRVREEDGAHVFKIDPHQLPVSQYVRARVKQLALDEDLLRSIRRGREDDPGHDLRILVGPLATGSAVLADKQKVVEVQEQHRKVIGIEMEAYGVYAAASHAGAPKPSALALKGVSDFADHAKDNSAQKYAAHTSANVMRYLFERYMTELAELAGS